jgi:hypothetical protein
VRWLVSALAVGALLAGCGSSEPTETVTKAGPPNLGTPRAGESHAVPTRRSYRPRHGPAEQANYYSAFGCGVERWAVKTLTDPGANQVDLTPQSTWIGDLVSIAPPLIPTDRVGPTETTTFKLSAALIYIKAESDSDLHLVIEDGQGNTMIAESPSPSCATGSLVLKQIESVRAAILARFPSIPSGAIPNVGVTLTGVGFFDLLHGQTGVAPNGIELHPLLSVSFTGAPRVPPARLRVGRGD